MLTTTITAITILMSMVTRISASSPKVRVRRDQPGVGVEET
jgi:hypothetical protein